MKKEEKDWDMHWRKSQKSLFGRICTFYRKGMKASAVRHFLDKYFPEQGVFAECGSGTSQTSIKINKRKRKLIAVDISSAALKEAKKVKVIDEFIKADIRKLPFADNSLDGIWNLGVMEHFTRKEIYRILKEFRRVLKKEGVLIIFWPPKNTPDKFVLDVLGFVIRTFSKNKSFQFFPDEVSRLKSKKEAARIMSENGFADCRVFFPWRDLFSEYVVVCRK